jgi:hypothetical protein
MFIALSACILAVGVGSSAVFVGRENSTLNKIVAAVLALPSILFLAGTVMLGSRSVAFTDREPVAAVDVLQFEYHGDGSAGPKPMPAPVP